MEDDARTQLQETLEELETKIYSCTITRDPQKLYIPSPLFPKKLLASYGPPKLVLNTEDFVKLKILCFKYLIFNTYKITLLISTDIHTCFKITFPFI